jgi:hypothetical protein
MCVTVLSIEQSDTTVSSGFMIAEAERRLVRVSVSATPDGLGSEAQPDQGMARRELRSKRMGDEKSGDGAAGNPTPRGGCSLLRAWVWET